MSITTTFDPPQPSDSPAVFNSKAFSTLGDLNTWSGEANALADAVNADADTATAKASEASGFASDALASKNSSINSAGVAATKAAEASGFASDALAAKNAAEFAASHVSGVNTGDQIALTTPNTPAGNIAATNVQDALNELDTEKAPLTALDDKVSETVTLAAGTDLNTVVTSGFYRINTGTNLPIGANNYGQLIVSSGGGTCTQIYTDYTSSRLFTRTGIVTSETITGGWAELIDSTNDQTIGGTKTFSGSLRMSGTGGLGYGADSGGTVTQATSKVTAVILHKPCGKITMHNAALAAGAIAICPFYSSAAGPYDTLTTTFVQDGTTDSTFYNIWAQAFSGGGGFNIFVKNISAASHSDAIKFNFAIIKGSIA